jgi:hypothetical protein
LDAESLGTETYDCSLKIYEYVNISS